jgi:hypothetical protein
VTSTDVRQWLREQGEDVSVKGPLPKGARERYAAAHGLDGEQEPADGDYPAAGPSYDGGVTEADFPAEDPPDAPETGETPPRRARNRGPREQDNRTRRKLWGGGKGKGRPRKTHPRLSVTGFVEDVWSQFAWAFQGAPPLSKLLYAQAPYAGIVLEDAVKGTVVDRVLQPVVRAERTFTGLTGLIAPPVLVMAIMTQGEREQTENEDGTITVGDYTPRTKFLFSSLRFSLMSMTRAMGPKMEEIQERAGELAERGRQVDEFIAWLFEIPEEGMTEEDAMKRAQQMAGAAA